ncbi:MAG: LptF/LptG family permease [Pseudomonadota bacterium]
MRQLDRYMFRQMTAAFLLFCLILTGVIWLTQAVRLIDTVLSAGQSAVLLVELSLLVLPRVLGAVIPLAGFAAVIYTVNKLYSEAELVVMMMAGQGPYALARPVAVFAVGLSLLTLVMTNAIAPAGERRLDAGRQAIAAELANSLLREGRFLYPTDGLTVFIREADPDGRMAGLFLHDERDPNRPVTYTAERAALLRDGPVARLVMSNGAALSYAGREDRLARVQFDEFTYDLSDLLNPAEAGPTRAGSMSTLALIAPGTAALASETFRHGRFMARGHERIVYGLHALVLPVLAVAVMLTGGYRRRGFGQRILAAACAGAVLIAAAVAVKSIVVGAPAAWAVSYLPSALGAAVCALLLYRATRARTLPAGGQPA